MEKTLALIILLFATASAASRYGKEIGALTTLDHNVAGTIYAINRTTIYVVGFSYDGTAPDAFFYAGKTPQPSGEGTIIPDETGSTKPLGEYNNQNLILRLPEGKTIKSFKWISIWCRLVGANFGHVMIDSEFEAPSEQSLGRLPTLAHSVRADDVIVLNPRQVRLMNLHYDGAGPAAYFWIDRATTPSSNGEGIIYPPEDSQLSRLPRFQGEDITVTLPEGYDIRDYGSFSLWCAAVDQNFGHVRISGDLTNLPQYMEDEQLVRLPNCEVLAENKFHIAWERNEAEGKLKLQFIGDVKKGEYMAFGISGSDSSTRMVGADVIVTYVDDMGELHADDYLLNDYAQCSPTTGSGACPDELQQNGMNNVVPMGSIIRDQVTIITVERPLTASDDKDKPIPNGKAFIAWAVGQINPTGHVSKHADNGRPIGNVEIDFSLESSRCPQLAPKRDNANLKPWTIEPITPEPAPEVITAHIGPAGGVQGYQGIAEKVGWGIAWYLNGQLIPELHVRRNCTYRFEIYGGNDNSTNLANFHPFYITNDENGGYNQKTPAEKQAEKIYAGPTGGHLCEYRSDADPDKSATFEEYKKTLTLNCPASAEPGVLEWFVTEDTEDVVYYQCYQHRFFGWKIFVSDATSVTHQLSLMVILVIIAALFGRN